VSAAATPKCWPAILAGTDKVKGLSEHFHVELNDGNEKMFSFIQPTSASVHFKVVAVRALAGLFDRSHGTEAVSPTDLTHVLVINSESSSGIGDADRAHPNYSKIGISWKPPERNCPGRLNVATSSPSFWLSPAFPRFAEMLGNNGELWRTLRALDLRGNRLTD